MDFLEKILKEKANEVEQLNAGRKTSREAAAFLLSSGKRKP